MEQLVARRAHNPKVARSSRVPATKENGNQILVTVFCFYANTYTQYIYNSSTGMYDPVQVTETYQERKPGFALFIPGLRWHQSEKKAFQFGFTGVVYDGEMWQIPIPMVQWYRTL